MSAAVLGLTSPQTTRRFSLSPRQKEANHLLAGPQRRTLLVGGARSGKTFLLTRAIVVRALRGAGSRHAILRFRFNAVRASVGLDTLPKVVKLCFPGVSLKEHRQDGFFELPNGSQIWLGGLDDKERAEKILGQEYATIYLNEASQIPFGSAILAETRLAQVVPGLKQRLYVDMNPTGTGHWCYQQFVKKIDPSSGQPLPAPDDYELMFLNPKDNAQNLDPATIAALANLPERQRRRFYDGQFVNEVDGALWTIEAIEQARVSTGDVPDLQRIVVAVDPSGTSGPEDYRSDEVGIVVAGRTHDGTFYVLADRSGRYSPATWGRFAVNAFTEFRADRIIAEGNFGGAMVEAVIKAADARVPVEMVTATRGKVVRAEPIAALYEQGRVKHVGRFGELEDQMSSMSTAGYTGTRSPDRLDALVWALTALSGPVATPGIFVL